MPRKPPVFVLAMLVAFSTQTLVAAPAPTGNNRFDAALSKAVSFLK